MSKRQIMEAMFYVLMTRCGWRRLPSQFGNAGTVYRYFSKWREEGLFEEIWKARILIKENFIGKNWKWPLHDSVILTPLGPQKKKYSDVRTVRFEGDLMLVELIDGRELRVPTKDFRRLHSGTLEQREQWEIIDDGEAIHWDELDEDLSVEGLIRGYSPEQTV